MIQKIMLRRCLALHAFIAVMLQPSWALATTLQKMLDAAQAGSILRVPAGHYTGSITIDKPLTLIAESGAAIDGEGKGTVVRITAPDVMLRGFIIAGSGRNFLQDDAAVHVSADRARIVDNHIKDSLHGIYLRQTDGSLVSGNRIVGRTPDRTDTSNPLAGMGDAGAESCATERPPSDGPGNGIHLWNSKRCQITDNIISGARDGIYFSFTEQCNVMRNDVQRVRYGLHYMYSDRNTFENNVFRDSTAGAAVMFSKAVVVRGNRFLANRGSRGCGILLQSVDATTIDGNIMAGNALALSMNQCYANRVLRNSITGNFTGVRFSANSEGNEFSMNRISRNLNPVEVFGDTRANSFSIAGIGNQWEGAPVIDFDGDGIGELPHRELDITGGLRREFSQVVLLTDSPLFRLLRFANQRAALPGMRSIQDEAPLAARHPVLARVPVENAEEGM